MSRDLAYLPGEFSKMSFINSSRMKKYSSAVVLACNAKHLPYAIFVASQFISKERERQFDVCICVPDLSAVDQVWLDSDIRFCKLQVPQSLKKLPSDERLTLGTYFKLLLPSMFASEYVRILYVDTDVYLRKPGIQCLFNVPLGKAPIFGAPDIMESGYLNKRERDSFRSYKKSLDLGENFCINAGVLLFQTKEFNQMNGTERMISYAEQNRKLMLNSSLFSQTAVNGAFAKKMGVLSLLWNWPKELLSLCGDYDPHIIHFTGHRKLWTLSSSEYPSSYAYLFEECDNFLVKNFPDLKRSPAKETIMWRRLNPKYQNPLREVVSRNLFHLRQFRYRQRLSLLLAMRDRSWINACFESAYI